jgi:hypothetical protein
MNPLFRPMMAACAVPLVALAAPSAWAQTPPAPFPGDYAWMNGSNTNPASPMVTGPLTWTMMVDTYYGYSFNRPADHTIFPTTTAPRHNEINLNLGLIGVEVTGVSDVIGKLVLQSGNYVDTITGSDATVGRGAYTGLSSMRHVQQAYAGYHLDWLYGANLVMGLFPAYIGLDSYWPQENWSYTHISHSDYTPYYLMGAKAEVYPRQDLKAEVWLVNGWQSISKFNEGVGLGYGLNWRPTDRLSLTHNVLGGSFESDPTRQRFYTNNMLQWKYAEAPTPNIKHLAVAAVADYGVNTAGAALPFTSLGGLGVMHRAQFNDQWGLTIRGSFYNDPQKLSVLAPPGGAAIPDGNLTASELTATLDFKPSPWLLNRLELRHDMASSPYIAGPGGLTAPAGAQNFTPDFVNAGTRVVFNTTVRF